MGRKRGSEFNNNADEKLLQVTASPILTDVRQHTAKIRTRLQMKVLRFLLANLSLSAEDITMNEDSDRSQSKQQGSPLAGTRTNEATALLGKGGSDQTTGQ